MNLLAVVVLWLLFFGASRALLRYLTRVATLTYTYPFLFCLAQRYYLSSSLFVVFSLQTTQLTNNFFAVKGSGIFSSSYVCCLFLVTFLFPLFNTSSASCVLWHVCCGSFGGSASGAVHCSLRAIRGESAYIYTLSVWKTAGMRGVWLNDLLRGEWRGRLYGDPPLRERERGRRAGTAWCRGGWTDGDQQDAGCHARRAPFLVPRGNINVDGDILSLKQLFFCSFFFGKGRVYVCPLGGVFCREGVEQSTEGVVRLGRLEGWRGKTRGDKGGRTTGDKVQRMS